LLHYFPIRGDKADVRQSFNIHPTRNLRLIICIDPHKDTTPEQRLYSLIDERGLVHPLTRSAPLGKEIQDDRFTLFLSLREGFIKERKTARQGQRRRSGGRLSLSAYHACCVSSLFDRGNEPGRLDLRRVILHHEFVAVEPHLDFLNACELFQSPFDRLRSAHSDGAAFTLYKAVNANRDGLYSFGSPGSLREDCAGEKDGRQKHRGVFSCH
jgi:hypothetical protein